MVYALRLEENQESVEKLLTVKLVKLVELEEEIQIMKSNLYRDRTSASARR